MSFWNFTSDDKSFSLQFPEHWVEYEDEANTYAFFNHHEWQGNLRITHFYIQADFKSDTDKTNGYIDDELNDNPDAVIITLGEWKAVHYVRYNDDENSIIYYWVTGLHNNLFLISFTSEKHLLQLEKGTEALLEVNQIIGSLNSFSSLTN
ncbi:MAG: DUF3805 domain-containing protein [Sphingobacteriaceae bacterium]|nr:MAG: DUF3805 domain-containing protein [Sphingobacteriaceae bacterium]